MNNKSKFKVRMNFISSQPRKNNQPKLTGIYQGEDPEQINTFTSLVYLLLLALFGGFIIGRFF